jgi:uncharacterized protein
MARPHDLARGMKQLLSGWRGLGRFWAGVGGVLVLALGTAQILGPPAPSAGSRGTLPTVTSTIAAPPIAARPTAATTTGGSAPKPVAATQHAPPASAPVTRPGRDLPGPIGDTDPALLEPAPGLPGAMLPRIAADGRMPMQVYAGGFDHTTRRARVGLLVAGIGMSAADSGNAIRTLPAGITLAVSPYGGNFEKILGAARLAEHEYLVSLPMEPEGYPLNDPDSRHALMTDLSPGENLQHLRWVLSRFGGYAGVTSILGQNLKGERFAAMGDQLEATVTELAHRGLLFVDARLGQKALPGIWSRSIDLVIDDQPNQTDVDAKLEQLGRLARDRGSALGVVMVPRPVTIDRVAAWTNGLTDKGLVLAPVSALALSPAGVEN